MEPISGQAPLHISKSIENIAPKTVTRIRGRKLMLTPLLNFQAAYSVLPMIVSQVKVRIPSLVGGGKKINDQVLAGLLAPLVFVRHLFDDNVLEGIPCENVGRRGTSLTKGNKFEGRCMHLCFGLFDNQLEAALGYDIVKIVTEVKKKKQSTQEPKGLVLNFPTLLEIVWETQVVNQTNLNDFSFLEWNHEKKSWFIEVLNRKMQRDVDIEEDDYQDFSLAFPIKTWERMNIKKETGAKDEKTIPISSGKFDTISVEEGMCFVKSKNQVSEKEVLIDEDDDWMDEDDDEGFSDDEWMATFLCEHDKDEYTIYVWEILGCDPLISKMIQDNIIEASLDAIPDLSIIPHDRLVMLLSPLCLPPPQVLYRTLMLENDDGKYLGVNKEDNGYSLHCDGQYYGTFVTKIEAAVAHDIVVMNQLAGENYSEHCVVRCILDLNFPILGKMFKSNESKRRDQSSSAILLKQWSRHDMWILASSVTIPKKEGKPQNPNSEKKDNEDFKNRPNDDKFVRKAPVIRSSSTPKKLEKKGRYLRDDCSPTTN